MRNMSFFMTTTQMYAQTKDITRRFGWWFLEPGDIVCAVEKSQGLQKGEKIIRIGPIKIISTRPEPLEAITQEDVIREGFPLWTPAKFIEMVIENYTCTPEMVCNRIEFEHMDGQNGKAVAL